MSEILANDHRVHFELAGPAGAPVIVLSNSLGTTLAMWDEQMETLAARYRVLRYDTRGLGGSEVTAGDYEIGKLGKDVLDLTSALHIDEFSFCGISMGGLIGQWLALHGAARLRRVVLCNTAPKIGDADGWNARIATARSRGLADIAEGAIARWFTPAFTASNTSRVEAVKRQVLSCDPSGYAANCAAVRDADFRAQLGEIQIPTLVIAGSDDPVTTLADSHVLAVEIPDAQLAVMNSAHLSNIGDWVQFNAALMDFLEE